jgi:hypothetical protein
MISIRPRALNGKVSMNAISSANSAASFGRPPQFGAVEIEVDLLRAERDSGDHARPGTSALLAQQEAARCRSAGPLASIRCCSRSRRYHRASAAAHVDEPVEFDIAG